MQKKPLDGFQECHENALNESCKMSPLWIRSGYDMKVEVSAETYQVGAHLKALDGSVGDLALQIHSS